MKVSQLEGQLVTRESSEAKAEDVRCNVDQVNENVGPSPRTEQLMTAKEIRIRKVLGRKRQDKFN